MSLSLSLSMRYWKYDFLKLLVYTRNHYNEICVLYSVPIRFLNLLSINVCFVFLYSTIVSIKRYTQVNSIALHEVHLYKLYRSVCSIKWLVIHQLKHS